MSAPKPERTVAHPEGWRLQLREPLYFAHVPARGCWYCALEYGESVCMKTECRGGAFLTEERYALVKLFGIKNLDPK